jgi:hypothetical protein
VVAFGGHIQACGGLKVFLFFAGAFLLELAKFRRVFFTLAAQTHFLNLQVPELLFVGKVRVELDQAGSHRGLFGLELCRKLNAALRVHCHFERGDAIETPSGVSERLQQTLFTKADRLELCEEVGFVGAAIVTGEQDSAAGECGL